MMPRVTWSIFRLAHFKSIPGNIGGNKIRQCRCKEMREQNAHVIRVCVPKEYFVCIFDRIIFVILERHIILPAHVLASPENRVLAFTLAIQGPTGIK